jgi:hypothetical protein
MMIHLDLGVHGTHFLWADYIVCFSTSFVAAQQQKQFIGAIQLKTTEEYRTNNETKNSGLTTTPSQVPWRLHA